MNRHGLAAQQLGSHGSRASTASSLQAPSAKSGRRPLRPSSMCGSSRGSSRGSSKSAMHDRDSAQDLQDRQEAALDALLQHFYEESKAPSEMVHLLTQGVLTKKGEAAVSEALVQRLVDDITRARKSLHENEADKSASKLHTASMDACGISADRILRAIQAESGLNMVDLAGQILWRNRRTKPLTSSEHRQAVESTQWIGDVQLADIVYRELTKSEGGRMRRPQWLKVVELLRRNPSLQSKLAPSNADRLFYTMALRKGDESRAIGLRDFLQLLVLVAENVGVHPSVCFVAVGCHADRILSEVSERPATAQHPLG